MAAQNGRLIAAAERYFARLRRALASGGATGERSHYAALAELLEAVGAALGPKVFCVSEPADLGVGHPDLALYAAKQVSGRRPREGQVPERGVVEVKGVETDLRATAASEQVARYLARYRIVLVTNLRSFVLTGLDEAGDPEALEAFSLALDADDFRRRIETPRAFAREVGPGLGEYLSRALAHRAALADPKDVARLLASYARDGLARVEAAGDVGSLAAVRSALEEALGLRFEGRRGQRFFASTLVQTLFYGVFSAWVLWSRDREDENGPLFEGRTGCNPSRFNWREAGWHLRAPVLRALFQQLADPARLRRLELVEALEWASAALGRVDRAAFFSRFDEGEAVPYFYEPFLEAFDPELRKQLGVWYTPLEVVRYMVARVDRALKDDLAIPMGLAADNVFVLDPCCGTGAFLAETLRRIAANLEERGEGALVGAALRKAATERVFGFEIMPAPFVVAHLQVGLAMRDLDAPLGEDGADRAGAFLTNALTGWRSRENGPLSLPFPELEEERDRAEAVKQDAPILVILGNPPYNGFADVAVDEERQLSEAYRTTERAPPPRGRGLNDLYVRFFRMAERRIAEQTGQGVVCFISNFSWLDGLSFTGMRENCLQAFDAIRIDCLNGDKYKTGKVAPDGSPDPSVFSTEGDPVGIQVGTAIATMVRRKEHAPADSVAFRHLWGRSKRAELTASAEADPGSLYSEIVPSLPLGLPFTDSPVSPDWFDWPTLPKLFPAHFSGVATSRDAFLVDIDLDRLRARIGDYFDATLSHEEIERRYLRVMKSTRWFAARAVRDALLKRGGPTESGFVRYAYRPFDDRWLYWEADTNLLNAKRGTYKPHVFRENRWLTAAQHLRKSALEPQTYCTRALGSMHLIERGTAMFPAWLCADAIDEANGESRRANLSAAAERYLERLGASVEDLFHHVLATLHDPAYREANEGALRVGWPRVPLPGWPDGRRADAAEALARSADRGRGVAALLDSDAPVPGVTEPPFRPEVAGVAIPSTSTGRNMKGDDFAVTAGWGYSGAGDAVMSGRGRVVERAYTAEESAAMAGALSVLGDSTVDVHLNEAALWRNVPAAVWGYRLGGYQVLKKWLSYREESVLGRSLRADEVSHFRDAARRIAALLLATAPVASRE